MGSITTKDGTSIYYKDWGEGPTVTFSHEWPPDADVWVPRAARADTAPSTSPFA
jgi:pimeloyl-ACP methyl ester carboxylesterase